MPFILEQNRHVSFVRFGHGMYLMIETPFMGISMKESLCFLAACKFSVSRTANMYETAHVKLTETEFQFYADNSTVLVPQLNPEKDVHHLNDSAAMAAYGEFALQVLQTLVGYEE